MKNLVAEIEKPGKAQPVGKHEPAPEAGHRVTLSPSGPKCGLAENLCAPAGFQQAGGNLAVQQLLSGAAQTKLSVSRPGDPDEQEADRLSEQVVSAAAPAPAAKDNGALSDKEPGADLDKIRRKRSAAQFPQGIPGLNSEIAAFQGNGQPLPQSVRAYFEPRFRQNFSQVRVHTDAQSQELARALQARAFTVGENLAFAPGEYAPQTLEGKRLLAHELTHVVQQQRAPTPARLARQPAAPPAGQPAPAAAEQELLDRENRALAQLTTRAGSQVATFAYESPFKPEYVPPAKVPTASLTMGPPTPRPTDDTQKRKGFDNQAAATAFAAVMGGAAGAVVLTEDKLWFAAPLTAVSTSEFVRDNVFRFTPSLPAVAGIGKDGFVFESKDYTPDEARAAKVDRPEKELAAPAAAADLRKMVGIVPEDQRGEGKARPPAQAQVPPGQEEAFIRSYFVARALEALNQNEAEADKLAEQFKPTKRADGSTGIDPSAQKMIDQTRDIGPVFKQLETLERMLGEQALWFQDKHYEGKWRIAAKGQRKFIFEWMDDINASLKQIAESKQAILSAFPLLATLVRREETPSDAQGWAAKLGYERFTKKLDPIIGGVKLLGWAWGKLTDAGTPPKYDDSPLAKSKDEASPEDNEKIAADFRTKLDGIHRAIAETRGKVTGDLDFVLGMASLRSRVKADLANIDARNKGLKDAMDKILLDHDIVETAIKVAETVVQIAALFLPGGQFISAAIGFAVQAKEMDKHLDAWTASQATVDPAKALVDQQQAESALLTDTVMMAVQAVDLAISVKGGFEAIEAGRVPKDDLVKTGEDVPKKPDSDAPPDPKAGDDATRKARALDDPEQMKQFAKDAPAIKAAWSATYKTPGERGQALIDMVNARLKAAKIPEVKFRLGAAKGAGGAFEHSTWTIILDQKLLLKDSLDEAELTWMIEASYHEGRHAEQFFMMARAEAGKGKTAEQLMEDAAKGGMEIKDPEIAKAAVAQKLGAGTPEAIQAQTWWESIYGSGRQARQKLLTDLDLAQKEVRLYEIDLEILNKRTPPPTADELEAAKKELSDAEARTKPLIDAYKKLPEEVDAYRIGEEAAATYRQRLKELTEERIKELQKQMAQGGT